jgi:integrase
MDLAQPRQQRPTTEIRPPTPEQVAALLESVQQNDLALFTYLRLAASTGARRSQLLALRWGDVDLDRRALSFTRALVEGPDGPVLAPTKSRRPYRVSLDAETTAIPDAHRVRVSLEGGDGRDRFVFSVQDDGTQPWKPNYTTKRFIDARRAAGLEHFRLHDLRYFMATEMLAAGIDVPTVSQRLSHARASTTLNVYAHVVPGSDQHAAETLSGIIATGRARP